MFISLILLIFISDDIAQQGRDAKSGKSSVLKKPAADTRSLDGASVAKSAKSLAFADGIKQCHGIYSETICFQSSSTVFSIFQYEENFFLNLV